MLSAPFPYFGGKSRLALPSGSGWATLWCTLSRSPVL